MRPNKEAQIHEGKPKSTKNEEEPKHVTQDANPRPIRVCAATMKRKRFPEATRKATISWIFHG